MAQLSVRSPRLIQDPSSLGHLSGRTKVANTPLFLGGQRPTMNPSTRAGQWRMVIKRPRRVAVPGGNVTARIDDGATVVAGSFVGRDGERLKLEAAAARARSGRATVVMITGEAGIGKSLLLSESLRQLELDGFFVLSGRAERMEQGIAYASLRQAVVGAQREWPVGIGEVANQFSAALDRPERGDGSHPSLRRVYQRATHLLAELCIAGPTVLSIDDVHVADADTVNLLALLARRLWDAPLLILLSRRSDWLAGPVQAIDQLEDGPNGDGAVVQLPLTSLEPAVLASLVESVLQSPADEALLEHVSRRSDGNPFFALETLHALRNTGSISVSDSGSHLIDELAELTPTRRRAILERIVPVDDDARAVAMAMAAFGHLALDQLPLLSEIADLDIALVELGFDQLFEVNVICRREDGGYGFSHDLVAETLYEELGPAARRRLHGRIAEGLNRRRLRGLDVDTLVLAKHLDPSAEPGDVAAALSIAAAGDETRGRAPRSAVRWYQRALLLLPGRAPERAPILIHLAQAMLWAGTPSDAVGVCREALDLLSAPNERARVMTILGEVASCSGRRAHEEVIRLIDAEISREGTSADLLVVRCAQLTLLGRYTEAIADAETVLDLVAPSTPTSVQALFNLAHIAHCRGRVDQIRKYTALQVEQASTMSRATKSYVATWAALHFGAQAHLDEANEFLKQARLTERAGPALRTGITLAELFVGWSGGDWTATRQAADNAAEEFLALGQYTSYAASEYIHAEIALEQGDLGPALAIDPERYPLGSETGELLYCTRAGGELAAGRAREARTLLERSLLMPSGPVTLRIRGRLVEACLADDDQTAAELALEEQTAYGSTMDRRLAEIVFALSAEQVHPGQVDLASVIELTSSMRLPFFEARLRLLLGARGVDPKANLNAAMSLFDRLEAAPWRQKVAAELRRQRLPVPRQASTSGELTPSELQIAQLATEGLTNREIAARLSYSIKTVQAYLSRAYEKLGVHSRVELTRVLHRAG
jgi:DNA-binding CsgD family transcriptional regulator